MYISFKLKHSLHNRYNESHKILEKYPDRVPIICERSLSATRDCPYIDKNKYLVPRDLTIGQFIYVIRRRMRLQPEKALFLFMNGIIPPATSMLGDLYEYYKENDGFIYITYSLENTFG
jgi:GABA(A) receptor-associated protein